MDADLGQEAPRKRRRPALACVQCRQRKVKCDKIAPCGPCVRYGIAQSCSYRGSPPPASRVARSEYSDDPNDRYDTINYNDGRLAAQPPQAHLSHPAAQTLPNIPGNALTSVAADTFPFEFAAGSTEVTLASLNERLDALQARTSALECIQSQHQGQSTTFEDHLKPLERDLKVLGGRIDKLSISTSQFGSLPADTNKSPELTASAPRASLRESNGKVRFWSPSHYLHSLQNHFDLFTTLKSKADGSMSDDVREFKGLAESCRLLRKNIRTQRHASTQDAFPELQVPPRQLCDRLVDRYFATIEMVYRVLHRQTFQAEYEQFWIASEDTQPHVRYKLLLVAAIGSIFVPSTPEVQSLRNQISTWCYAVQWWLTGPSEQSTFTYDGLQIRCLLTLVRRVNGLARSQSEWVLEGSLLRLAYTMGLHCRPSIFRNMSPYYQELRSRLWMTILELTLESSADAALPPPAELEMADSQISGNFDDKDFDETSKSLPTPKDDSVFTENSIARLLFTSFRSRLDAVIAINKHGQQSYDKALSISSCLRKHCGDLHNFFGAHAQSILFRTKCPDFHQKLLRTICNRQVVLLQRPFIEKARTDPRFSFSRKIGLDSAIGLLSQLGVLDGSSNNDFDRLTLHSVGTFKGAISTDVIATVCIAVIYQLEENSMAMQSSGSDNVLSTMGKAYRDPLLKLLEHTQQQLLAMIARGDPSLKRYILLTTALSHIRAKEAGRSTEKEMRQAMMEGLQRCHDLLQRHLYSPLEMTRDADMEQVFENFDMELGRGDLLWLWACEGVGS